MPFLILLKSHAMKIPCCPLILLLIFSLYSLPGAAQVSQKGNISLDLGAGAGFFGIRSNVNDNKGGAVPLIFQFRGYYTPLSGYNTGLEYRRSEYLRRPKNDTSRYADKAFSNLIMFNNHFHVINKERFGLYIGPSIGYSNIELNWVNKNEKERNLRGKGFLFALNTGIRWLFNDSFGMFLNVDMLRVPYLADSYSVNGQSQGTIGYKNTGDVIFNFTGQNGTIGVSYRF